MPNVAAVILSAGESQRMGSPKALLNIGERTLLEDQSDRLQQGGINDVFVVVGANAVKIQVAHEDLDVIWIENEDWKLGTFSSIKTALKSIADQDYDGCLLLPIDVPGVPPKVIRHIWQEGHKLGKNLIPQYEGDGGHPVYLTRDLIMDIGYACSFNDRLDKILHASPNTEHIEVFSKAILNNINTPEEWRAYLSTLSN